MVTVADLHAGADGKLRRGSVGGNVGAGSEPAPTCTKNQPLSEIIRQLKTFSARRINEIRKTPGVPVWQRNYYESIVPETDHLEEIRKYIV